MQVAWMISLINGRINGPAILGKRLRPNHLRLAASGAVREAETGVPIHHFMGEDLAGSLLAICLLTLFLWVPGYSLAWLLDLFDFRRRTAAFRIAFIAKHWQAMPSNRSLAHIWPGQF